MKRALILGVGGQDGHYTAQLLLSRGYNVVGTRRPEMIDGPLSEGKIEVVPLDLRDADAMEKVIESTRPTEIYNFAAYTSGADMFVDAVAIGDINGLAVARLLEAIRRIDPAIRFCQASSSEIFGDAETSPQVETTRCYPRSPYGAAKLYAHEMVRIYRERYGLFACSAILFNHESPRRGVGFVTRKVTQAAARIGLGLDDCFTIGNLDARRDWGAAADYVRAMHAMLQASTADDFVIATGRTHSVRDLCERAFTAVGLDYRRHIRENATVFRTTEATPLVGNASKARRELDWVPSTSFEALIDSMVESDLAAARNEQMMQEDRV